MSGKIKAIVLLGVVFGLGVVSGVAWQRYQFHRWPEKHAGMFAEHRMKRLKKQLNLTSDQEKTIGDIFQKAHERATQVNEEVSWDLADIHRDSMKAIEQVLTPSQVQQFEKIHERFHAHHKNMPYDDTEESTGTPRAIHP